MRKSNFHRTLGAVVLNLVLLLAFQPAIASDYKWNVQFTALSSLQTRNDIQIPNTNLGTRFSLADVTDDGPVTSGRVELNWMINQRHGIRVLLAPLTITDTVTLTEPVLFAGESFAAQQDTEATYRFNSWRLGYHYLLRHSDAGSLRVGATLKVRDAEIRLEQGGTVGVKENVGIVPLLYIAGKYQLTNRWSVGANLDGLAGGPGRAIDLGIGANFAISKHWQIGAELRVLDGGADTEEVYNFAQFNSAAIVISTGY